MTIDASMDDQRGLTLSAGSQELDLYSWMTRGANSTGHEALAGITGFGLPGVEVQWHEGAGDGATYRGSRVTRRAINLPLYVRAGDRSELNQLISQLATVLSPDVAPARLKFSLPDGEEWFIDVIRTEGGDWARMTDGSDNRTWVRLPLTLEAGDPYWTRVDAENFQILPAASMKGLLPGLAKLEVGDGTAFGRQEVENTGDAPAWPVWTLTGPFETATLISGKGERLEWTGSIAANETLIINTQLGTAYDGEGNNRYDGFAPAPAFWPILPGISEVQVEMTGTSVGDLVRNQLVATNLATNPGMTPASTSVISRRNIIKNPSFEIDTTGWEAKTSGHTIARDTSRAYGGSASLRVEGTPAGNYADFGLSTTGVGGIPVISGTYQTQLRIYALDKYVGKTMEVYLYLDTYTSTGSLIGTVTSTQTVSISQAGWLDVVSGTFSLSSSQPHAWATWRARIAVNVTGDPTFWVDQVLLERPLGPVGSVLPYFDGSTSPSGDEVANWVGSPHNSDSTLSYFPVKGVTWTVGTTQTSSVKRKIGVSEYSAKLVPLLSVPDTYFIPEGGASMDGFKFGFEPGKRYRVSATVESPGMPSSPVGTRALAIMVYYTRAVGGSLVVDSTQAPFGTSPEVTQLSLDVTIPEDAVAAWIHLTHGGDYQSGPVYWSDLMVQKIDTEIYDGPRFDGSHAPAGYEVEWAGAANESISRLYDMIRVNDSRLYCEWRPRRWAVV